MYKANDNNKLAFALVGLFFGMLLLAFASVPIYKIFCKATGTGGTTQRVQYSSKTVGTRNIKVKFDSNINDDLPWEFKTEQSDITVKTGQNALIFYSAKNLSDKPVIGTAVYNVTPHKAAIYFNKIQCFCFEEQLLKPGEKMAMPVSFFIDPELEQDKNLKDLTEITLSYSFFKVRELNANE